MDVLEDKEDKYNVLFYCKSDLPYAEDKAAKTWHQLKLELDQREVAYKAYVSEYPGHATRLANMICNKADKDIRLIVVGGHGTANEVINGMEHFEKVTFGYIPSGSGNDLGRGLGISAKDPLEALQRILEAEQARYMDLGRVSWADDSRGIRQSRLYAISAGIGFDALVCELALHAKLKTFLNRIGLGKLVYLILTVKSMRALQVQDAYIEFEGGESYELKDMVFAAAMNQPYEGGGVPMAPDAKNDDGLLSVIFVEDIPKKKMPRMLLRLLLKKHKKIQGLRLKDTKSVRIHSDTPLVVHSDGEFCGYRTDIRFEAEKGKLRILC